MQTLKKAKKPKPHQYPLILERQFQTALLRLVKTQNKDVNELLIPQLDSLADEANVKLDDYSDKITGIMGQLDILGNQQLGNMGFGGVKEYTGTISNEVNKFNHKDFNKVVKAVIGVDIFKEEPWLKAELNNFSEEASSYITKMSNDNLTEIARLTRNGVASGLSSSVIKKQLKKQFDLTETRAKLIARDQVGKLNGALTKKRQEAIGVKEYKWRTSQDERVVGTPGGLYPTGNSKHGNHYVREGKTYKWSEPPSDGNPGFPIRCRCYGEMVLPEDLLNEHGFTNKPPRRKVKRRIVPKPVESEVVKTVVKKVVKPKPIVKKVPTVTETPFITEGATIKQIEKWGLDNNISDFVDFGRSDPKMARIVSNVTKKTIDDFPEVRTKLKFTGTMQARRKGVKSIVEPFVTEYFNQEYSSLANTPRLNKHIAKEVRKHLPSVSPRVQGNFVVHVSKFGSVYDGVALNSNMLSSLEKVENVIKAEQASLYSVPGIPSETLINHELGHAMDSLLEIRTKPRIKELWKTNTRDKLSSYGNEKIGEMVAEGWAEYRSSATPRAISKEIGEIIENEYKNKFGK